MTRGTKPSTAPAGNYVQPGFELLICPLCGSEARWKTDRRGAPYHSCPFCFCRIFPHGAMSLVGFEVLHAILVRFGAARFRHSVQQLLNQRQSAARMLHSDKTLGR